MWVSEGLAPKKPKSESTCNVISLCCSSVISHCVSSYNSLIVFEYLSSSLLKNTRKRTFWVNCLFELRDWSKQNVMISHAKSFIVVHQVCLNIHVLLTMGQKSVTVLFKSLCVCPFASSEKSYFRERCIRAEIASYKEHSYTF